MEKVEFDRENVYAVVQAPTGVDIIKVNGSINHILGAKTDGETIWIEKTK